MSFLIRRNRLTVKGDVFIRKKKGGRFNEGVKGDNDREWVRKKRVCEGWFRVRTEKKDAFQLCSPQLYFQDLRIRGVLTCLWKTIAGQQYPMHYCWMVLKYWISSLAHCFNSMFVCTDPYLKCLSFIYPACSVLLHSWCRLFHLYKSLCFLSEKVIYHDMKVVRCPLFLHIFTPCPLMRN